MRGYQHLSVVIVFKSIFFDPEIEGRAYGASASKGLHIIDNGDIIATYTTKNLRRCNPYGFLSYGTENRITCNVLRKYHLIDIAFSVGE